MSLLRKISERIALNFSRPNNTLEQTLLEELRAHLRETRDDGPGKLARVKAEATRSLLLPGADTGEKCLAERIVAICNTKDGHHGED